MGPSLPSDGWGYATGPLPYTLVDHLRLPYDPFYPSDGPSGSASFIRDARSNHIGLVHNTCGDRAPQCFAVVDNTLWGVDLEDGLLTATPYR